MKSHANIFQWAFVEEIDVDRNLQSNCKLIVQNMNKLHLSMDTLKTM
jgi:hypothetical protein